uniref:Uncharacterized protein n=1 Tax=Amphiprion percula TaxID=161767 RepID=A0A3P8S664_AMPPE
IEIFLLFRLFFLQGGRETTCLEHVIGDQHALEHVIGEQHAFEHVIGEQHALEYVIGEQHALEYAIGEQHTLEHVIGEQHTFEHVIGKQHALEHVIGEQHALEHAIGEQHALEHVIGEQHALQHVIGEQHTLEQHVIGEQHAFEHIIGEQHVPHLQHAGVSRDQHNQQAEKLSHIQSQCSMFCPLCALWSSATRFEQDVPSRPDDLTSGSNRVFPPDQTIYHQVMSSFSSYLKHQSVIYNTEPSNTHSKLDLLSAQFARFYDLFSDFQLLEASVSSRCGVK